MQKRRLLLWSLVLAVSSASPAFAWTSGGTRWNSTNGMDVTVQQLMPSGNWQASGVLGTARLETYPSLTGNVGRAKEIGCSMWAAPGGVEVTCTALTGLPAPNDQLMCVSDDPAIAAAAAGINGDSLVTFIVVDRAVPNPTCVSLTVDNNSKYQQKAN
jgi:hypothetical protein